VLFAAVSLACTAFGVAMLTGMRTSVTPPTGDAAQYLSMIDPSMPGAEPVVPSPYRYRILVPWVARQLPFSPSASLSLVTYASLAVSYFLMLLTCERIGVSGWAGIGGLAVAFAFEPHLYNYYNPYLVDGAGLMVMTAMTYAFVADAWWTFAVAGLAGAFVREITAVLLPLWGVRSVRRSVALTAIVVAALAIEHQMLAAPGLTLADAFRANGLQQILGPSELFKHVRASWSWAILAGPLGLCLLEENAFRRIGPPAVALLAAAVGGTLLASDLNRMVFVLMPVVAVGTAQLVSTLMVRRQRTCLALLGGLVVVTLCTSGANAVLGIPVYQRLVLAVPTIRLGTLWTITAAVILRRELLHGVRDKLRAIRRPALSAVSHV
jgi:hypothetical protein